MIDVRKYISREIYSFCGDGIEITEHCFSKVGAAETRGPGGAAK